MVNDHARLPGGGHAPGHLRNEFLEALEAHYKNRQTARSASASRLPALFCGTAPTSCPGSNAAMVADLVSGERRGYSYAAAARQIRSYLT